MFGFMGFGTVSTGRAPACRRRAIDLLPREWRKPCCRAAQRCGPCPASRNGMCCKGHIGPAGGPPSDLSSGATKPRYRRVHLSCSGPPPNGGHPRGGHHLGSDRRRFDPYGVGERGTEARRSVCVTRCYAVAIRIGNDRSLYQPRFSAIQTHPSCRFDLAADFSGLRRSEFLSQIINYSPHPQSFSNSSQGMALVLGMSHASPIPSLSVSD